jgi:mannose-6-phosphate isomerase-like protein (cupin superfamily)
MSATSVNLANAARGLADTWSPRVAGRVNDVLVKVARVEGEFVWHDHPDTDEAFLVLEGTLVIDVRDPDEHAVVLNPSDLYVIPRGVEHRPRSAGGATIALFEGAGVVNTGGVGGTLTAPVDLAL